MAIPAPTEWEVRPTGAPTNGGGFVHAASGPGADYSQQDSPAISVTDAVLNGTTTVTSASANFDSTHTRNIAYIDGDRYAITAVNSSSSITVDRATGSGSGKDCVVGGAGDNLQTAYTHARGGNRIWITGTHDISTGIVGGPSGPHYRISLVGYGTQRWDYGRATLIAQASMDILRPTPIGFVENICFDGNSKSNTSGLRPDATRVINCVATRCVIGFGSTSAGSNGRFINCLSIDNSLHGWGFVSAQLLSCTSVSNGGRGYHSSGTHALQAADSIFAYNAAEGINLETGGGNDLQLDGCTVAFNGNTGIYCRHNGLSGVAFLRNTIVYGNSGYGVRWPGGYSTGNLVRMEHCAFGANTSGPGLVDYQGIPPNDEDGTILLTEDPFVDAENLDFSLNDAPGGGAPLKAF